MSHGQHQSVLLPQVRSRSMSDETGTCFPKLEKYKFYTMCEAREAGEALSGAADSLQQASITQGSQYLSLNLRV